MGFRFGQAETAKWQETEYLLRVLLSRLNLMLICPDPNLDNNIRTFVRALREGQSIHEMHSLMKDISGQVDRIKGSTLLTSAVNLPADEQSEQAQDAVFEVMITLLDNINFPDSYTSRIENIKTGLEKNLSGDRSLQLVTAITALTGILDDIFERVDRDKKKIDKFLNRINTDLKSLDEGIAETQQLHSEKKALESSIDIKVTSEVHEMESMLSSQLESETVKENVLVSLQTIRSHMDNFKHQEEERNKKSDAITAELQSKLDKMENECAFLKQQVQEKQEQVLSDPLTGIRNRLAYEDDIKTECDRFNRYGRPLSLLLFEVDGFKEIVELYGKGSGDKILQIVARTLSNSIREVDIVARYGGHEFVVILPEMGMNDARQVGMKICKAIADQKYDIGGKDIMVSISGGIARMHQGDTPECLYDRTEKALRLARERGGNRVEVE